MFERPMWTPSYGSFFPNSMSSFPRGLSRLGLRGIGGAKSLSKGINWSGLFSGAQKTLGIVNQALPIVKEAKPMFNNMKTMIKLASAFKDETTTPKKEENNIKKEETIQKHESVNETVNSPQFFL